MKQIVVKITEHPAYNGGMIYRAEGTPIVCRELEVVKMDVQRRNRSAQITFIMEGRIS